jgi:hypothetical protein
VKKIARQETLSDINYETKTPHPRGYVFIVQNAMWRLIFGMFGGM